MLPLYAASDGGTKQNVNKSNAQHSIIFEAVALALAVDADTEILAQAVSLLGKFITVREPNIKYLGLENMVRLAEVPAVNDVISRSADKFKRLSNLKCVQKKSKAHCELMFCG